MPRAAATKTTAKTAQKPAEAASTATEAVESQTVEKAPQKPAEAVGWRITVEANPNYCGKGACGLHFAHGEAETDDPVHAAWFEAHDGYKVELA